MTLDGRNVILPSGVSLQKPLPGSIDPESHIDIVLEWNGTSDLNGTFSLPTDNVEYFVLVLQLCGELIDVENSPTIDSFGLVFDSGDDATDRLTVNPKVTGTVTGNRADGNIVIEFDHNGDGIVDGRVTLGPDENTFVYDPRNSSLWQIPTDQPLDVVLSYRLVHRDSFGDEFSTGNWVSFEYSVTPPTTFSGTVSELTFSLRENGDWTTPHSIEIGGYAEGAQYTEIVVDTTGEKIVLSSGYGYFQACLAKGLPLGITSTIRVRGFIYDTTTQMELYGDWQATCVKPLPPNIGSLTLEHDTGTNSNDGISSDLTLVGRISSSSYSNGVYCFQKNSHVEVELRCGETVLGYALTNENGDCRFNVRELPLVNGYREGTISARTVGRTDDGVVIYGNEIEKRVRYEPAPLPIVSGFSAINPHRGIVRAGINVPIDSNARLEFSYNIGDGWSTPFLVTPVNPNELASGATSETRIGEFYLAGMEQLTDGQSVDVRGRAVVFDSMYGENIVGSWQTISFVYEAAVDNPAGVQSASIKNWTGQPNHSTADPTITGVVSNDGSHEGLTVEVWSGDKLVGSTTADSNGNFTVRPTGLSYGNTTLSVKVREWNTLASAWQYGDSETITFVLLAPTVVAPSIQSIALNDVTSSTNNVTSNARIEGLIGDDGSHLNRVLIEFDLDGDSVADTFVFTDADGHFGYTPDLPPGSYSIFARACRFDAAASDWVSGSWTKLTFTLTAPERDLSVTVTEVGPAFVVKTENGVAYTNDPALAGRVTSPGGFGGVVVQIDLDADGNVDRQMGLNADGTFRWRPVLDENAETTISGIVRAGKYDLASNEVHWGEWTSFSYQYVPATHSHDEESTSSDEAQLKLVYTTDPSTQHVTATGVQVVGGTPDQQVCFDVDGDGTVDFVLAADEQGFISFDRLQFDDPDQLAEGLFIGNAWISGNSQEDVRSTIKFAIVNLHDDTSFDESELIEQQNEFYRGYVTLLEAFDELDQLTGNTPPVETPSDVGETITDQQRHQAKLQALARLGLTESDLALLEGATAPALPSALSDPLPDITNDIAYQTEVWRINNDYHTAVADLTRNYSAGNLDREIQYDSLMDSAWSNYYHTISALQNQQAAAGAETTTDMQAAWAAQLIDAEAALEIAILDEEGLEYFAA